MVDKPRPTPRAGRRHTSSSINSTEISRSPDEFSASNTLSTAAAANPIAAKFVNRRLRSSTSCL
jgi:hypothetical protein